jgi:hypothetical protein
VSATSYANSLGDEGLGQKQALKPIKIAGCADSWTRKLYDRTRLEKFCSKTGSELHIDDFFKNTCIKSRAAINVNLLTNCAQMFA